MAYDVTVFFYDVIFTGEKYLLMLDSIKVHFKIKSIPRNLFRRIIIKKNIFRILAKQIFSINPQTSLSRITKRFGTFIEAEAA